MVMMGDPVGRQDRLFYEFDLEDMVPAGHLPRRIDAVLELSWLRSELAPHYSHTDCLSVDPELLIRMLAIGYCYSIRSERRLCQDVKLILEAKQHIGVAVFKAHDRYTSAAGIGRGTTAPIRRVWRSRGPSVEKSKPR